MKTSITETPHPGAAPAPPTAGGFFARTAGFAHRRRWLALLLWVTTLVGVWVAATVVGNDYREDFSLPGTESQQVSDLLEAHGSNQAGDTLDIVLHDPDGLRNPATEQRVQAMLRQVDQLPRVAEVRSPYQNPAAVSEDSTVAFATVVLDVPSEQMEKSDTELIHDTAKKAEDEGLQVELGGEAARMLSQEMNNVAEAAGVLAALVILVLMFGTVVAAGLPIVTALFAVGSTLGAIVLASHVFTIAEYTTYVMILVGLGVGIDYALLIFARYRAELVRGTPPEQATIRALDAAGRTVCFAGTTVIVALLGLVALGLGSLQGIALSVALTVLVTMIASVTLLPALLGVFGERFARQFTARAARRAARNKRPEGTFWRGLSSRVQRRPLAALLLSVVALGAMALPALDLRLGFSDAGNDAPTATSRKAYDLLADGFGPGFNGPLVVVADGGDAGAEQAAAQLVRVLETTDGIAATTEPTVTGDGRVATVIAFPDSAPQDVETSDLVGTLRDEVLPAVQESTGAEYLVGGATAATEDYSAKVADRMPIFVALVVGVSVVLLMAVFRSVLIALKAALLNLLSIGAALGAMALVFQNGLLGTDEGPIEAFLPVMIFAIVFGLSMDYEIFLVSRIHEEWQRTRDPAVAIREGLAHTGSVITAAGAIMIVVFGAFMLSSERMLQQFGFGMAVAILMDALVIRCLIVPAAMQLMGRHAWWMPASLGRLLPRLELESHPDADQGSTGTKAPEVGLVSLDETVTVDPISTPNRV